MDTDFPTSISMLVDAGVEFVIVGGLAATVHGSARLTSDLDIVYARTPANMTRLATALSAQHAYLRGAPPGLPFVMDAATLQHGLNFTLTTDLGPIDLLGEMLGAGKYEDIAPGAQAVSLFGKSCLVVSLPTLIAAKRAAGRPKDLEVIAELEALLGERSV